MLRERIQKIIFLILSLFFIGLVGFRAAHLSFTHDESGTYLFFRNLPFWDLFSSKSAWPSANNHLLNTILYQKSITLFGHSDFALRLPNVLAFIGLIIFIYSFTFKYIERIPARILLFSIIILNPYVIDFFSLCRGYGLSMFFHLGALYFIHTYTYLKKVKYLYLGFTMVMFASLSLMTNLILFPVYTLPLWIISLKEKQHRSHLILAPASTSLISLALLIRPILYLQQAGEFNYGASNIWLSIKSLIENPLAHANYLGPYSVEIFTASFIILICFLLFKSFKNKELKSYALSILFLLLVLFILRFALNIYFPVERKTTLYIPILAIFLALCANRIYSNKYFSIVFSVFILLYSFHFVRSFNLNNTKEWYYDSRTKNAAQYLKDKGAIRVKAHWKFHPSMTYYITTMHISNITLLPYSKDYNTQDNPDIILGFHDDYPTIEKNYEPVYNEEYIYIYKKK